MNSSFKRNHSSFRDPDAFVFSDEDGIIYRQLNQSYKEHYLFLKSCGLYDELISKKMLIPHQEIEGCIFEEKNHYQTILPEQISFISYPYEWCFEQLKDAALLTLRIMKQALKHDMVLKDATPFNIQFHQGKCIFIDTSSFEKYSEGNPWIAYRQFCENFLAPLALSHYLGDNLNTLLATFPNGIPLETASKLLPFKSRFSLNILLHIHFQAGYKKQNTANKKYTISKNRLFALIDSLESTVKNIYFKNTSIGWTNYYSETVLNTDYVASKRQIIETILDKLFIKSALDLGANNGFFSEIVSSRKIETVSSDFDAACVNELYLTCKKKNTETILPLVLDIANPTPAIGWANTERSSFLNRSQFDLTLALALIHHLAIGKNIPLSKIAETLSSISTFLIIEFVPKNDGKVQLLLQNRKDIFTDYSIENFENEFQNYFTLKSKEVVKNTERVIYLFKKKQS